MKLQFKHQKFQADAAKAVVDVFAGQPYLTPTYMMDRGYGQQTMTDDADFTGWRNERIVPELSDKLILEHLQKVQRTNQIKPSDKLEGRYNLTIEMETGVGKTYTYIKTMYELNKHYGWSKFIVVVPSIAIREGVYKSFQVTQEHFAEEYGKKIRFFIVYIIALIKTDRKVQKVKLIDLLNYSRSNSSVHEHQSRAGLIFLLFSVVMLTLSFYSFAGTKQTVTNITIGAVSAMLGLLCFFRGFVYIIHEIFNKSRKWKYRGSHLVTLRMFLSKSEKMSFSLGVISILFTCTIVCIGMTNAFYQVMEKAVVMQPFDLAIVHVGENGDYSQYSSFLNERIDVSSQYSYCLYTDKSTRFTDTRNHLLTEYWNRAAKAVSVNDYVIAENQHDAFMKYSDYCNLRAMLGLPQISLAEGQYIIHCLPYLKDTFYANENLQIKNSTLAYSGICTEAFSQYGGYGNGQDFVIVVPDHYIENMEVMYSLYVVQSKAVIDMSELENTFPQVRPLNSNVVASGENGYTTKILDNGDYYYTGKLASTPTSQAILIILPLCYLSLVIGIISIVILAVQLLTEVKTIKRQYNVIRTLGNEVFALEKMLRKHIFLYFTQPLVPALVVGSFLLKAMSYTLFVASYDVPIFDNLTTLIAFVILSALLIFALIYFLYVFITSQAMRKEIIPMTLEK